VGSGPTRRLIVIAPTRAACETIELAFGLDLETTLWRSHGAELTALAEGFREEELAAAAGTRGAVRRGFGIVAGTGTGKTLSIRPIAHALLGEEALRVGVINREREATPESPSWNVVIVTTGIARRWFQDGDIRAQDALVVDEIHQTSAELELCLALGKRVGCRFIWLSATVDPSFYARYLNAASVVESSAFDPSKGAKVEGVRAVAPAVPRRQVPPRVVKAGVWLACSCPRARVERGGGSRRRTIRGITSRVYHGASRSG
jgi:hypothetical protein